MQADPATRTRPEDMVIRNFIQDPEIDTFLQLEAHLLDAQDWDGWVALYDPAVEYWVPMWDQDGTLTTDPTKELSLIYYRDRRGLEDRVFRLRTNKSAASTPPFRTAHLRSRALLSREGEQVKASFSWVTHAYRHQHTLTYFGLKELWLAPDPQAGFAITRARTVLQNDLIDQVIDFYHL